MKTKLAFLVFFSTFSALSQTTDFKRHYVNMTELGIMAGYVTYDIVVWNNWGQLSTESRVERRISPTLQMFNGVQLNPRLAVGVTTGIDLYNAAMIIPLTVVSRYELLRQPDKNVGLFAALDAGYGLSFMPNTDAYKDRGGLVLSPALGFRLGGRKRSAFLLTVGYKHQRYHLDKSSTTTNSDAFRYEDRRYNRLTVRVGLGF